MNNNGCFYECTNCKSKPNCCSLFDKINAPVLNKKELDNIKNFINNSNFYNIIDNNLYTLKLKENKCIFYINDKCTIYDIRPCDCRLYPFDIINLNEKYYLILYYLECINIEYFQKIANNIDFLVNEIKPWIKDFTNQKNYDKMQKFKYIIIKEITI